MNHFIAKNTISNFLSIVAGVAAGIVVFILLAIFFFSIGMLLWTDGGTKEEIANVERNLLISIVLMIILSGLIAGFTTSLISIQRNLLFAIITGITLIIASIVISGFQFTYYGVIETTSSILILLCSFVGGWIGVRVKKRRKVISNTPSSPPGTAEQ